MTTGAEHVCLSVEVKVRGYHAYSDVQTVTIGKELLRQSSNTKDALAVVGAEG